MNNRENLYHHFFYSSKHGAHTECFKRFTMGLDIAKRSLKGKEHQRLTVLRECEDQGKVQNNCFQNKAWFKNIVEQPKSNTRNSSHVCWPWKFQLMQTSDSLACRKMWTCWKLFAVVNCKKGVYGSWVRCLEFQIKNANIKY